MKIIIETVGPVPAAQIANMLRHLHLAYREYAARNGLRRAQLAVSSVEPGSIEILVDAIDSAQKIWEARELLIPFASHLMDCAGILLGTQKGQVTPTETKALQAIVQPVASGNATQINIVNNYTIHLNISSDAAVKIAEAIRIGAKTHNALPLSEEIAPRLMPAAVVRALESDGAGGTAILVDGEWYARLLGGQGVLIPLRGADTVIEDLKHKGTYRFHGAVLRGSLGEAIGIDVRRVEKLGAN